MTCIEVDFFKNIFVNNMKIILNIMILNCLEHLKNICKFVHMIKNVKG